MTSQKMRLKPVRRASLVEAVADQIRETIERTGLRAGDRLPSEPELVEQLAVSRTVLREAISRLQTIGLLSVRRGRGTFVADPAEMNNCLKLLRTAMTISSKELARILELREAIEVHAARLAAERATEADLAELESLCRQMERDDLNLHQLASLDLQFHLRIVGATGNGLMLNVFNVLQEFVVEGILRTTPRSLPRVVSQSYHLAIVEAIRTRDPEAAANAVLVHIRPALDELEKMSPAESPAEHTTV